MIGRDICLEKSAVNLDAFVILVADTRGRKDERIEDVVVWIAAIVTDSSFLEAVDACVFKSRYLPLSAPRCLRISHPTIFEAFSDAARGTCSSKPKRD